MIVMVATRQGKGVNVKRMVEAQQQQVMETSSKPVVLLMVIWVKAAGNTAFT